MVRGVNRQVIEVADTGSEEFERAILFVHPDCRGLRPDQLAKRARSVVRAMEPGGGGRARRRWPVALGLALAFLLGLSAGIFLVALL